MGMMMMMMQINFNNLGGLQQQEIVTGCVG